MFHHHYTIINLSLSLFFFLLRISILFLFRFFLVPFVFVRFLNIFFASHSFMVVRFSFCPKKSSATKKKDQRIWMKKREKENEKCSNSHMSILVDPTTKYSWYDGDGSFGMPWVTIKYIEIIYIFDFNMLSYIE